MADFNTADFRRETVPATAQPVAGTGPNPFIGVLGGLAKEGLDFLAESNQNKALVDYNRSVDNINQQLEQGAISQSQATSKIRSITSRALAANPQYTKEISQAHNAFSGSTAVGEALDREEQMVQIETARVKEATLAGWALDGMSEEEQRRATAAYFADKRVDDELDEMRQQMQFETSQTQAGLSIDKARQDALKIQREEQSTILLGQKVQNHFVRFNTSVGAMLKNVNRSDPEQVRNLALFIDGELATIRNESNNYTFLPSEVINRKLKPFEDLATAYKTALTDDESFKALGNQIGLIEKGALLEMYIKNPELAQLNASSEITKSFPPETVTLLINSPGVGKFFTDIMSKALGMSAVADPLSGEDAEREGKMKVLKETLNLSNESDRETAVSGINRMLRTLNGFALVQENPKQFRELAQFLSSPEFAKMVSNGELEEDAGLQAATVMQINFQQATKNAAVQQVKDTFTRVSGKKFDMPDVFDLQFAGTGLVATRKDVLMNVPDRGNLDRIVREIKPALQAMTQSIKITSHLNGHTDYKRTWEEQKGTFFPAFFGTSVTEETGARQEALDNQAIPSDEMAEITAQIESGEAAEVTPEDIDNMSEADLKKLLKGMTGSQRTALLRDRGFVE